MLVRVVVIGYRFSMAVALSGWWT